MDRERPAPEAPTEPRPAVPPGPPPAPPGPPSRPRRRRALLLGALAAVVVLLSVVVAVLIGSPESVVAPSARCTVTAPPASPTLPATYALSPEQADSVATITGVGRRLAVPDRAVTIALATAVQESGLANLQGGDRDSVGLFQQRPSQGWGTVEELLDPVYASTAFYEALLQVPGWASLDVTQAAQRVQRSGFPEAYADHEPESRLMAVAFLGQAPGAFACRDLDVSAPARDDVAALARAELGTARLTGTQTPEEGWALASWLVGHAERLALDRVAFDGRTWTAATGTWTSTGPADARLALHRVGEP